MFDLDKAITHRDNIRKAKEELNAVIEDAAMDGISVDIDIYHVIPDNESEDVGVETNTITAEISLCL